jgi:hypothetical protein
MMRLLAASAQQHCLFWIFGRFFLVGKNEWRMALFNLGLIYPPTETSYTPF